MKTELTQYLLAALLGVAFTLNLHAQTSAFTYQGQLTDNGRPANGSYDLTFSLWDTQIGSQQGGTITNLATTVSNGLFTVTLDFGASVFDGNPRSLEIGVATNGSGVFSTLSPRQPLTSTPYAVRAANAASASSVSAANITGTINVTQLPATIITNGASGVNITGTFSGDGSAITNVDLFTINSREAITFTPNWGKFVFSSSPGASPSPSSVAAADVNGDGKVDLIGACLSRLVVLTNNGSAGFVLSSTLTLNYGSDFVTTADVNGDGKVDLIGTIQNASALAVFTNNGSGGFTLSSTPSVGSDPYAVTVADVNGDGKVDLISANNGDNTLTVLTNNGSGGFVLSSSPGVGSYPNSVAAADINGDGKVDLISANSSDNTLTVLTNNGSGGFVLASSPGVGTGPYSVAAADVNGDGKVDLISANSWDNTLTVLTNNGSGGFVLSSSPVVGGGPRSVTSADVNDDGKVDLISANNGDNTLTVLTNNGSGGFVLSSSPVVGSGPQSVTAADVNGDGHVDLISANVDSTLTVLLNTPASSTANFSGNGSGLTSLDAANITTGTLGDAQLSANVALLNRTSQAFTGKNTFAGNVGIGTNNPQATLHVVGSILASGEVHPTGIGLPASFGPDPNYVGTPGNYIAFGNAGVSEDFIGYKNNTFYMKDSPGGADTADPNLVVGGHVGIGTDTPRTRLDVVGNVAGSVMTIQNQNSDGFSGIYFHDYDGTKKGYMGWINSTATSLVGPGTMQIGALGGNAFIALDPSNGDVGIGTAIPGNKLTVAGNVAAASFVTTSDRNAKQDFQPVSPTEVLRKVAALPITTWQFKTDHNGRHLGPMAQDFYAAFGLGNTDTGIATVDEDGVALAAIQGLNQKLEATRAENAELRKELQEIKQQLSNLTTKENHQ